MRWAGHAAGVLKIGNRYTFFVGKPEEKKPLGRSKSR
jgi:hypothetical protein